MDELAFKSAVELTAMLRKGEIKARTLMEHYLDRIAKYNPQLNAIVQLDAEAAREAAKIADLAIEKKSPLGPLHGLPMTIKDAYEVAGMVSTAGAPEYANHIPENNADVVERLRKAGAIIIGKTNVPFMSGDWQSYNKIYGCSNNPHNLDCTPGGSSGGAAASIAAGLVGADIGSDIGGSIRIPAHFCGIYGLKPSYGLISLTGHIPPPPGVISEVDLSVGGPLGRSSDDLSLLFSVMMGRPSWELGRKIQLPLARFEKPADLRVAVWADDEFSPVSAEVRQTVIAAGEVLADIGANVDINARPNIDFARSSALYETLLGGIMASGFPKELVAKMIARADSFEADDYSHEALQARGVALRYGESLGLLAQRGNMKRHWRQFFQNYDVVLMPVAQVTAFPHDNERAVAERRIDVDGVSRPYLDLMHWINFATLCHLPAVSAPFGKSRDNMPIGVQIVGPQDEDYTVLAVAKLLEEASSPIGIPANFA